MRVLLTGGSGFVGDAIAGRLLREGCHVVALGRRPLRYSANSAVEFCPADLGHSLISEQIYGLLPLDAVVHAAARISFASSDSEVSRVNCAGTHQLVEAAIKSGIPRFVYVSSISVTGSPSGLVITEAAPLEPRSAYAASKAYGEFLVAHGYGSHGVYSTLRVTAPVGSGIPAGRLPAALVRNATAGRPLLIYGQGNRRQNYVDIRDVAQAVWLALQSTRSGLFNIGGSCSISNSELAETVIRELHSESSIVYSETKDPEDGQSWTVSIDEAKRLLGYAPLYDISASIRAMAADCDRNPASG